MYKDINFGKYRFKAVTIQTGPSTFYGVLLERMGPDDKDLVLVSSELATYRADTEQAAFAMVCAAADRMTEEMLDESKAHWEQMKARVLNPTIASGSLV